MTTGNVEVDQTDATLPGLGLGLRFSRSYNSHNSAVAERYGVFGAGLEPLVREAAHVPLGQVHQAPQQRRHHHLLL